MSVVLLGAGRSASVLINFLGELARQGLPVTIADADASQLAQKCAHLPVTTQVAALDNPEVLRSLTAGARVVISLLPPPMHPLAAQACLVNGAHLITASYVSPAMQALDAEAKAAGLLFLNECGLDPGIDHASALSLLDHLRSQGAEITHFASWCGGLVAPASDDNPWGYKISWNPMNVLTAGTGGARFLEHGQEVSLNQKEVFQQARTIQVGQTKYDGYANRDSLPYRELYGLTQAQTVLRGTLRKQDFAQAWAALLATGFGRDLPWEQPQALDMEHMARCLCQPETSEPFEHFAGLSLWLQLQPDVIAERLHWLLQGSYQLPTRSNFQQACLDLLLHKWELKATDRDMVVMQHEIDYVLDGQAWRHTSRLVREGRDNTHSAMAETVGLPLGIAAQLVLEGKTTDTGVQIPITPQWYQPLLHRLATHGIVFEDETHRVDQPAANAIS